MNKPPALLYPLTTVIAAFAAICLLSGSGTITQDRMYTCAGKSDNGMISTREFPTLHVNGRRVTISGSDMFSTYSYEICTEGDALVTFASQQKACAAEHSATNSQTAVNGSFNPASGLLKLDGPQGMLGQYHCGEGAQKY